MREHNLNSERNKRNYHSEPAFSVQDEIKRNRRIERNKRIRQARATGRKAFAVILSLTVVVITLLAVLLTVMRVRMVTVSGNVRYSAEEILMAAELDGDILPLVGDNTVYKKVVSACPYVNGIELKKTYPSSVEIIVTEADVVYCADIHGRRYSLDTDLRVIEFTDNSDGLIFLQLPEIVSAVEGSKVVFAESRYDELVPTILAELLGENTLPFISIDVTNRFSVTAVVGDYAKIDFGDYNDIPLKLKAAGQLLNKATEQQSLRTFVNVSTLSGAGPSMILDYEGEF